MKIFVCNVCGHIEFNEASEKCLVCRASKDSFKENNEAIEKVGLPDRKEADNKHVPKIITKECGLIDGCLDVFVKVGEVTHPMLEEHYIRYIDFYQDYNFISRVWLSPKYCNPGTMLHLKTKGKITVIENCNKHGNWMSEVDL